MTRWAVLVAFLYLLILVAITCPVLVLIAYPNINLADAAGIYSWWPYWFWVAVMFLCQAALLLMPVRALSRRPVTRRPLIVPVVLSGFMAGILVVAAWFTAFELLLTFTKLDGPPAEGWPIWSLAGLGLVSLPWLLWTVVFYQQLRRHSVEGAMIRQQATLLSGSILELLVAIPTHVVARNQNKCCAGGGTAVGLIFGTSVMLFAFGPAVFFLFLARWRQLRPRGVAPPQRPTVSRVDEAITDRRRTDVPGQVV